jgi:hypothetical protein
MDQVKWAKDASKNYAYPANWIFNLEEHSKLHDLVTAESLEVMETETSCAMLPYKQSEW